MVNAAPENHAHMPPAEKSVLRQLFLGTLAILTLLVGLAWLVPPSLTAMFFILQDRWLLALELLVLAVGAGLACVPLTGYPFRNHGQNPPQPGEGNHPQDGGGGEVEQGFATQAPPPSAQRAATSPVGGGFIKLHLSSRMVLLIALAVTALCYAGHRWLLLNYDLSRDEQMAVFDSAIYAQHHMAWPLPLAWQVDANLLNTLFMLPVKSPAAWVSGYLPVHAMLRAGFGAMTGPLMTGASVVLLWAVARRLWPDDKEPAVVALLLALGSGQMVMMGMTAYAMPAHLAANLLWLWLFLADKRRMDLAAIVLGFLATGLHQPLFHPLFVAPWLLVLLLDRRWGRLGYFALSYTAIGLFWLYWPHITHDLITGPHSLAETGDASYLTRLFDTIRQNGGNLQLMGANLLRFFTWQHALLLPLLLAGRMVALHDRRAAALALGFIAPAMMMAIILPYQGHGWGYRYLHGVIGNAALLGAYGWRHLAAWHTRLHGQLRPIMLRVTVAGLVVILPVQMAMAHHFIAPFAHANARITASGADYAIIGADDGPFALDLVLNRPNLSNRPIRLVAGEIDDPEALAKR
ncbi:MAG: hypothetical protein RLY97_1059, partial [Pseudomonadota bacterium]